MKNKYSMLAGIITAAAVLFLVANKEEAPRKPSKMPLDQKVAGRFQQEFDMTKDPALGYVPQTRLLKAYQIAEQKRAELASRESAVPVYWQERGPNNVGGRTRGLIFDMNDATWRTVWAGGVAGGLWRTTNISAANPTWTNVDDFFDNLAITSIAQDPSDPSILYFATGETGFGNADAVRGLGIWRSMDGGASWQQLPNTVNVDFRAINKVVVNNDGTVYAATASGLRRSINNGDTWTKILGSGFSAANDNVQDFEIAANGNFYAGIQGDGVYRFQSGSWSKLTTDLPVNGFNRVELACAPGNGNVVYAAFEDTTPADGSNPCKGVYHSTDGGDSWTTRTVPANLGPFCWYALIMAVDPNDSDRVWIGDVNLFVSGDAGDSWNQIADIHADHHAVVYRPNNSDELILGNDGGVYWCSNGTDATPTVGARNSGYNTVQYYATAVHPTAGTNYILGGTQDNGTQRLQNPGLGGADRPTGNDGAFCFIDQDNPNIQITGSQNRLFFISTDGGGSFNTLLNGKSRTLFITPANYDNGNDIFYFSDGRDTLGRMTDVGGANTVTFERITQLNNGRISAIAISPTTNNRIFIASENGRLLQVDAADQNGSVTVTNITGGGFPGGYISCIAVQPDDDSRITVTFSNYGVNSVWQTPDGGTTWTSIEGDLPDMPVRWAMYHPFDYDQLLLATELGVWSTDDVDGGSTQWWPTNNFGLANVRVDMFSYRPSDHLVIAGTHGRGIYSTDYFTLVNACPPNLLLSGNIAPGVYVAEDYIQSDGTIGPGAKVIYQAAGYIDLVDGFWSQNGSDFWALIAECGAGAPKPPDKSNHEESVLARFGAPPSASEGKATLHCYPNPADYRIWVQYTLPLEGNCSVYLRTLQGRLVQTLTDNEFRAAGTYSIELNAGNLDAGVYILTVQTPKGALTERLIVAR